MLADWGNWHTTLSSCKGSTMTNAKNLLTGHLVLKVHSMAQVQVSLRKLR